MISEGCYSEDWSNGSCKQQEFNYRRLVKPILQGCMRTEVVHGKLWNKDGGVKHKADGSPHCCDTKHP